MSFNKKTRNAIRQAEKRGVRIERETTPKKAIEVFNKIKSEYAYWKVTRERDSIMKSCIKNGLCQFFIAYFRDEPIAVTSIHTFGKMIRYGEAGLIRKFSQLRPMNYLIFEAAKWGQENGYEVFDLFGGVGDTPRSKFKRGFSNTDRTLCRYFVKGFISPVFERKLNRVLK